MSSWDKQAALEKYSALFDEAGDEAALIKMLGSPTRLAISLAGSYVPSPAPRKAERDPLMAEFEGDTEEPAPEAAEEEEEEAPPARRKVRVFGLIVSWIFGLVIGLPVAVVLICLGIPFLVLGGCIVAAVVWAVISSVGLLTMFSDILVVVGAALIIGALGLLVAWFGLWLSLALGHGWIGGVVLRLGRWLSYKKEVAAQ